MDTPIYQQRLGAGSFSSCLGLRGWEGRADSPGWAIWHQLCHRVSRFCWKVSKKNGRKNVIKCFKYLPKTSVWFESIVWGKRGNFWRSRFFSGLSQVPGNKLLQTPTIIALYPWGKGRKNKNIPSYCPSLPGGAISLFPRQFGFLGMLLSRYQPSSTQHPQNIQNPTFTSGMGQEGHLTCPDPFWTPRIHCIPTPGSWESTRIGLRGGGMGTEGLGSSFWVSITQESCRGIHVYMCCCSGWAGTGLQSSKEWQKRKKIFFSIFLLNSGNYPKFPLQGNAAGRGSWSRLAVPSPNPTQTLAHTGDSPGHRKTRKSGKGKEAATFLAIFQPEVQVYNYYQTGIETRDASSHDQKKQQDLNFHLLSIRKCFLQWEPSQHCSSPGSI